MRRVSDFLRVVFAALLLAGAPQALFAATPAPHADPHAKATAPAGHAEEKAGLPQLDPAHFPGQAFWFLIAFAVTYVMMRYVALPQVENTLAIRSDKVEGDIADAKRMNDEAKRLATELDARMNDARSRAQDQVKDAAAAEAAKLADALARQQKSLDEQLRSAQNRINSLKDQTLAQLDEEATGMVEAIVKQLTGKAPSPEQAKAAWKASETVISMAEEKKRLKR